MSEANKEALLKANAAITQGDYEGFLRHCTEDTEWIFLGDRTVRGKEAVRKWMQATYREPPRFRVNRMIAEGDSLAVIGEIALKDGDGNVTNHAYCDVWRFRGGKLAELRAYVVEIE